MTGYKKVVLIAGLAAMLAAAGCAKKEMIKQEEPPQKAVEVATPVAAPVETAKYDVKKGDSLWKIAAGAAYGNAFEWPLIFKANRDQIQDPDLIEANQQLNIAKDFSQAQTDDAVQKAKDTPPFKKHSEPRKKLPLMY